MNEIVSNIILETKNVQASYGESRILWGMDVQVQRRKVTTIMGRNGIGKTTFLRTIMGLVKTKDPIILIVKKYNLFLHIKELKRVLATSHKVEKFFLNSLFMKIYL